MLPKQLLLLCFAVATTQAQNNDNNDDDNSDQNANGQGGNNNDNGNADDVPGTLSFSQSVVPISDLPASYSGSQFTYETYNSQITVSSTTTSANSTVTSTSSGTDSQSRRETSTSQSLTEIGGLTQTANSTASSTSSAAQPSNTVPCNGYPEFCNRKYSNITHVVAHNSAFSIPNNAASNQYYDTETQLNDGVRMIQGETHYVNDTVYMCHTSCDLLNAGPWQGQLELIVNWIERHPYDVVSILVVNSDMMPVEKYVPAIEASGIKPYLYEPDYIPQHREQWPTLGEMILSGKRVVLFMDYMANQPKVPYILNEFIHIWETPFSPTDQAFPCVIGRPPKLNETKAEEEFMYLANHNLNTAVKLGALTGGMGGGGSEPLLIPNTAEINNTNGEFNEYGQAEATRLNCTEKWNRPPQFLLVDYYNYGDPDHGSVFEVAARANGVEYTRDCCGAKTSAAPVQQRGSALALALAGFGTAMALGL